MIKVKVPATSANLGVGFDCLGLAVSLYSEVSFDDCTDKLIISGCPKEFQNEDNLVYQAFVAGCKYLNQVVPNLKISINNSIPVARGLGSSAFCIVAGLRGAFAWFNTPVSPERLLNLATQIEGHPDNVAPAINGQLSASFIDDNQDVQTVTFTVSPQLHFVALIPDYQVSTQKARQILPKEMSYQTAIYQIGHAVALAKAFELGSLKLIKAAIIDKMHEPYRCKLIPDYQHTKDICQEHNGIMYISGSGSTMMSIVSNESDANKIVVDAKKDFPKWKVLHLTVDDHGVTVD